MPSGIPPRVREHSKAGDPDKDTAYRAGRSVGERAGLR